MDHNNNAPEGSTSMHSFDGHAKPFNPTASDAELAYDYNSYPGSRFQNPPQQWDNRGNAVGAEGPSFDHSSRPVYSPTSRLPASSSSATAAYNDPYAPSHPAPVSTYAPPPGPPPPSSYLRPTSPNARAPQPQPPTPLSRPAPLAAPTPLNPIRQPQFPIPETALSSPRTQALSTSSPSSSAYNTPANRSPYVSAGAGGPGGGTGELPNPFGDNLKSDGKTPSTTQQLPPVFHTPTQTPPTALPSTVTTTSTQVKGEERGPLSPFSDQHAIPSPQPLLRFDL